MDKNHIFFGESLVNDHYAIFRWGDAQVWWCGKPEKIAAFKKWVDEYAPKDKFGWHSNAGLSAEFAAEHISGWFKIEVWTFLINWWAKGKIGPKNHLGETINWQLANNFPGIYQ